MKTWNFLCNMLWKEFLPKKAQLGGKTFTLNWRNKGNNNAKKEINAMRCQDHLFCVASSCVFSNQNVCQKGHKQIKEGSARKWKKCILYYTFEARTRAPIHGCQWESPIRRHEIREIVFLQERFQLKVTEHKRSNLLTSIAFKLFA